jgi:hypothetical protein
LWCREVRIPFGELAQQKYGMIKKKKTLNHITFSHRKIAVMILVHKQTATS